VALMLVAACAGSSVAASSDSSTLSSYGTARDQMLVEMSLHARARSERGFDGVVGMVELERPDSTVTFARIDHEDAIHSLTFNIDTASASTAQQADSSSADQSLLSTSSTVGGACAKPLCSTIGPWQARCLESVCYPLCLSTVFDVEVVGAGESEDFVSQLAEPQHQNAANIPDAARRTHD
jgi:hypothetical protein